MSIWDDEGLFPLAKAYRWRQSAIQDNRSKISRFLANLRAGKVAGKVIQEYRSMEE
jgi:hypothetical protein